MRRTWRAAVVCLLFLAPAAFGVEHDHDIALLYVEAAYDAYEEGRLDRARRLAGVAREFAPDSSDALYVAALLAAEARSETRSAIALAARAAESGTWRVFDGMNADVLRARLWNRVGSHEQAARLLAQRSRLPDTPSDLLSSYYYEHAHALHALGRDADRDRVTGSARDRFPDDPRFFWFEVRSEPFPSAEYRGEIERLVDVGASSPYGPGLDDLLYEYGMRAPVEQEAAWALAELAGRGWDDPRIALLWFEVEPVRAVERFVELDGWRDYHTWRLLDERLEADSAEQLRDRASAFSGISLVDPEHDGVWNERITVDAGSIARWERDDDQDGIAELDLVFSDDEPASVTLAAPGAAVVDLEYGQYPFVTSARISAEVGSELFVLRPRSVRLVTVANLPSAGPVFGSDLSPLESLRVVERGELISAAVRIDLVRSDGTVAERTFRQGGVARQVQRDGDGDGMWDHLLLTDGGFATSGVRDLDGDGYFEVAEGYRAGKLVALAVDADDDGEPEVFEREAGVPVREWDLNEDGTIDVREFSWWTEAVIREFPPAERRR